MQIFISKLQHKFKLAYGVLPLWLLSLWLIIGKAHAANDSEFIHINSELNDDFYNKVQFFSSLHEGKPNSSEKIKQGLIPLLITTKKDSISLPSKWSDLVSQIGIQYAWKSSADGRRFFDYINTRNPPLKVASSPEQYIQNIANNASDYDIYLGLTTAILKKQEQDLSSYGCFGVYQLPKLELNFNQGMLADLFSQNPEHTTFRGNNRVYTATINRLIIFGFINGKFDWKTNKTVSKDGLVINNSDDQKAKVLRLPGEFIIAPTAKIEAGKDKTGLKITDENAIIAGKISNSGIILGGTAVEIGDENKRFPLVSIKRGEDLPSYKETRNSQFTNSGIIKTYDPHGVAFKINCGYSWFASENSAMNIFEIINGGNLGVISGKIQSNNKVIVNVLNDSEITIPADNNSILINTYESKEHGRVIIEFDDNFGSISQDTTVINLRSNMLMHPKSKIILSKADHVKIKQDAIQKQITILKSESGLYTKNYGEAKKNDFDKHLNNILCLKTFTENDKKFVILADANIDSDNTTVTAEFKVVEVNKDAPDIIPLSKIDADVIMPLIKLTPSHKKIKASELTPSRKIIKASELTPSHKSIKASELTPSHKIIKASELTAAHEIVEYLPFNKNTSKDYYKRLIVKIKKKGTIEKLHPAASNNFLANKYKYLTLAKGIDVKQLVTVLDDINADTEISHQHLFADKITFEYLDNIKKTGHLKSSKYDLADSTLYLGLTVYQNLHSHQYELGLFNYIGKDKNPAFEFDLGFTAGFNKVAMSKNKIQLKNIIVTSILDATSSQQAALLITNSSNVDKSLNLAKGLIIANTGKLLASNKNNSQAALVISSNKEKSMLDTTHTTGNEKVTTKHLISGGIYNYGLISGNIAVNIGDHGCFFPLKTDSDSAFLDNHGQIISNNIAVTIFGKQTEFTKKFNLINQKQGVIEGRIQEEKDFASDAIEFNVVNHGVIKIPAENNSICVSNYNNIKDSTLIIKFKEDEINTNDAIINIEKNADFDLNSSIVFDFANYNVNLAEHDIIHVPLISSHKFAGNKDKLFYIKPIINDDEYVLYNVEINQHISSNNELELEIISKEVFDLEKESGIIKTFPTSDIKVTNIANKIKTLKMLAKKNKTYKEHQVKKIHDAFIDTHTVNHALEHSKSLEEYMDYILPNNSSPAQLANQKIFSHVISQIYSRVMNRNIYSKYFYLQKSATNIHINDYMHNAELWSSTSYYLWNNKETNSLKNKIKNYLLTIGCDYEFADDTILGISYGVSQTNYTVCSEPTNVIKTDDKITTHSFSVYTRFNLKVLDGIAIVSRNDNSHNVEIQNNKKPEFKSATYALNIGAIYTTSFYDFHLDLSGLIGLSKIHVAEHESQYEDPTTHKPVKISQQSDILTNISIGPAIYNKIYLSGGVFFDYNFGISYNFMTSPKVNKTDSNLINSHRGNSLLPNKHSINLNMLNKLLLNEHIAIELALDGTIEKNSTEYGASFAFRYLF